MSKVENEPRFPEIVVDLIGRDGNAFSIMGRMRRHLRRGGVSPDEIDAFLEEAKSGDYDHLLATCMRWVTVE